MRRTWFALGLAAAGDCEVKGVASMTGLERLPSLSCRVHRLSCHPLPCQPSGGRRRLVRTNQLQCLNESPHVGRQRRDGPRTPCRALQTPEKVGDERDQSSTCRPCIVAFVGQENGSCESASTGPSSTGTSSKEGPGVRDGTGHRCFLEVISQDHDDLQMILSMTPGGGIPVPISGVDLYVREGCHTQFCIGWGVAESQRRRGIAGGDQF
jgi:hypothetical protein